jgi:hypothetical protein
MKRRYFLAFWAVVVAAWAQAPPRIVAVGDVHGDLDRMVDVLTLAGVLDAKQQWSGGTTQVVMLGDLVDRGPNSKEVLDFVIALDKQATKAGGRVRSVIGNHEAMRMEGDLRYVPRSEYAKYTDKNSDKRREKLYQMTISNLSREDVRTRPDLNPQFRIEWEKQHPLGEAEFMQAFSPEGPYGKWILEQDVGVKLGDTLFMHGGISPKYAEWSLSRFNDRVKQEMREGKNLGEAGVSSSDDGPLWFRGYAMASDEEMSDFVDYILDKYGVKRLVVGHTVQEKGIRSRLGGKVILADPGLSAYYGGPLECVVIEGGEAYRLGRGKKTKLN